MKASAMGSDGESAPIRTDNDPCLTGGGSIGGTSLLIMHPDTGVVVVGLINLGRADNEIVRDVVALFVQAASRQRTEQSH